MFNKSYNIAAAERSNKESGKPTIKLNVKLLDDSYETFNISSSALGQTLLDTVCDCIEIMERDYFGICFSSVESKTNVTTIKWLKMNKLVRKQLKGESEYRSLTFRVRFIPGDINQMQEAYTRYQLFLQLKQDILTNVLSCSRQLAVQLAALSLQSELGDYNPSLMKPGYEAEFRFITDQNASFESDVAAYHESLKPMKPEEAELKYLNAAKTIPQFGCDLYSAELFSVKYRFGYNAHGIAVFPGDNKESYLIPWNSVDKVLNKSKLFIVKIILNQPVVSLNEMGSDYALHHGKMIDMIEIHQKHSSSLKFQLPTSKAAKEIWLNCIETHAFFRMRDPATTQLSGGALKKSYSSFFNGGSGGIGRSSSFFSGRRTLPELLDIRRRNRTLDRSFVRIPSKRYNRRPHDKAVSNKGRNSLLSSITSNNRRKSKDPIKVVEPLSPPPAAPSESESSDAENNNDATSDNHDITPAVALRQSAVAPITQTQNFRLRSNVTQSVRMSKTNVISPPPPSATSSSNKPFQTKAATHSSLPRRQANATIGVTSPTPPTLPNKSTIDTSADNRLLNDATGRSSLRSDLNKPKPNARPSINEMKGRTNLTKSSSTSSGLGDGPTASNMSLNQSCDRLFDGEAVVDVVVTASDGSGRYGFSISGGSDQGAHVLVTKVQKDSPADQCTPKLCAGDQIIKINDRMADELTNDQIKEIIRSSGQKKDTSLHLVVKPRLYIGDEETQSNISDDRAAPSSPSTQFKYNSKQQNNGIASSTDLKSEMKLLEESVKSGSALQYFEKLYKHKHGLSMNEAKKPENLSKNRYKDILPYDDTRVVLRNGDYINANFIKMDVGNGPSLHYIAAQGPTKSTSGDFIQMLWEQRVSLIVMLTELSEQGRPKCHQYWPSSSSASDAIKYAGGLNLSLIEQTTTASDGDIVVRQLRLQRKQSGDIRRCTVLQFRGWPDHDVPQDTDEFIRLMEQIRQHRTSSHLNSITNSQDNSSISSGSLGISPIVVHCSAGIGRTGVVISMDIAMTYIDNRLGFSMLAIVKELRNQRAMLVQSQKQYKFLCLAILHYYSKIKK